MTDVIEDAEIIMPPELTDEQRTEALAALEEAVAAMPKPRASGSWAFSCPKRGHEADATMPPMMAQLADRVFQVRICIDCGCPFYIEVGRVSPLVGADGNALRGN